MRSILTAAALTALTQSTLTLADVQKYCPSSNICYRVAVPEAAAASGSGNLYFQIEAPTSYTWVALGTGSQMRGSYMFIMYTDGAGNVTVSPRLGTNHQMPVEDTSSTAADITLLAGSGVDGSTMRANILCTSCNSWNGGSMSLGDTSSSWIAAWKSGSSIGSTSRDASIQQHDSTDSWNINLQQATVSSDSNPFVTTSGDSNSGSSGSGSGSGSDSSSGSSGSSGSGDGNSGSSSNSGSNSGSSSSGGVSQSTSNNQTPRLIAAHGIIMAITFVIMYPIGSILMPLLGKWAIHAAWHIVSFIMMWVGFALGVVVSQRTFINFTASHTILGTVVTALMVVQPVLGFVHHRQYLKTQSRGAISHAHIWYGRILMLLGVINGGLGLQLASAAQSLIIAYAVVAAIIGVAYIAVKLFDFFRKRRTGSLRSEKIGSNGSTGRHDKYSPTQGEEVELPRRPHGSGRERGHEH